MAAPDSTKRFEALLLPHMNSAFNVARWLTRNDQDAEDVLQEAYLRAFRFFDGFRGEEPRAWLLSIVRNTFYTWHQQRSGHQAHDTPYDEAIHDPALIDESAGANPEAMSIRNERSRHVHDALRSLSLEYREVLVLRELEDLSYREIADIVGIPIGTVMSRLGRGRRKLALLLASLDEEP